MIDTSVLVDIERRGATPTALANVAGDESVFLSVITASELLYGVHRATDPIKLARRSAFVEAVLARIVVLPIELVDARAHGALRLTLERQGTPIGPHDLWIAAQALARDLAVATANVREFARVPGLRVIG